jgi:hypothetical protein
MKIIAEKDGKTLFSVMVEEYYPAAGVKALTEKFYLTDENDENPKYWHSGGMSDLMRILDGKLTYREYYSPDYSPRTTLTH